MPWKTCTATNALSRPCAGESSASSAALKRSSIGKLTGWRSSAARGGAHGLDGVLARHARTPSPRSARAARRRRSRSDQSTRSRCEATADAKRFRRGIVRGKRRATSLTARKAWLSSRMSLDVGAAPGRAASAGRRCASCVRVSATSACGKVQNSKWSCASARSCSVVEDVLERLRLVDVAQPEGGHAAQRDRGDDAERAERRRARRAARRRRRASARCRRRGSARPPRPGRRGSGSRVPVPCVPVASAPASDWASMSPRFGIASPRACSSRESACRRMPASTRTSPVAASASSTRCSASRRDQRAVGDRAAR